MSTLTERINGRYDRVTGPPMHTFRDSGIAVKLRKLSPMTSQDIVAQCRRDLADSEPKPPIVEIDYGQGTIKEPNRGDPTYTRLHAEWETEVNKLANERLFKLAALDAVEITIGAEERAQIARAKRIMKIAAHIDWQDDPELTEAENLQYFYIRHIACGSPEDVQEFYQAVATRSQPTEAAIERHKETFPRDVSGSVDLEL